MAWSQRFPDPILLPDGRRLLTLRHAGAYVAALPAREQKRPHWQTAAELLLLVAGRGGDPMLARIAMMRALNHGKPLTPASRRKARQDLSDRQMKKPGSGSYRALVLEVYANSGAEMFRSNHAARHEAADGQPERTA